MYYFYSVDMHISIDVGGDDVHDVKYALGDFYIPMQFYGHYAWLVTDVQKHAQLQPSQFSEISCIECSVISGFW